MSEWVGRVLILQGITTRCVSLFSSPHLVVHGTAPCPVCIQGQILHFHNFTLGSWDPENLPHSPLSELSQCWSVSGGGGECRTQRRPIQKPSQPELAASLLYRLLLGVWRESQVTICRRFAHTRWFRMWDTETSMWAQAHTMFHPGMYKSTRTHIPEEFCFHSFGWSLLPRNWILREGRHRCAASKFQINNCLKQLLPLQSGHQHCLCMTSYQWLRILVAMSCCKLYCCKHYGYSEIIIERHMSL